MDEQSDNSKLAMLSTGSYLAGATLMSVPEKWAKNNHSVIWAGGVALWVVGTIGFVTALFSDKKNQQKDIKQTASRPNDVVIPQNVLENDGSQKSNYLTTVKPQTLYDYAQSKNQTLEK